MSRTLPVMLSLFALLPAPARAQTADPPRWEVSGSAAVFAVRPGEETVSYGDHWYFSGRYGVALGRYWTEHLKTEVEYAISTEESTYLQRFSAVGSNPAPPPYGVESFHRVEQASVRMVWQFAHNSWVHPYVSGGLVVERDRQRARILGLYRYPPGQNSGPMIFVPDSMTGPATEYRVGVTAGAGAKIYMTQNAFFNTGVMAGYARPAAAISLLAGFGVDF